MNCFKNHNLTDNIKPAFTLAEVLITLVIIGVITALTIPALITNIQDSHNKTAWKRAFSDFSQATLKLATDNGGSLVGVFNNHNDVRDKLIPYFSVVKTCDKDIPIGPNGCWSPQIYRLSGGPYTFWDLSEFSRMVLNNGMSVALYLDYANCTYDRAANDNGCAKFVVDINGLKPPNTVGKDIYFSEIVEDGHLEPFGTQGDYWDITTAGNFGCDLNVDPAAEGMTCSAQYLRQ